jgi:hypothetical protein
MIIFEGVNVFVPMVVVVLMRIFGHEVHAIIAGGNASCILLRNS